MTRIVCLVSACLLACSTSRLYAQCGEPPSDYVCSPREISGAPGEYVVIMDVANASSAEEFPCGYNVGHTVWFKVVPEISGPLVFTTCLPETTYDTVLAAYTGSSCEFLTLLDCIDDSPVDECSNACGTWRGSKLTIYAELGTTYWFGVGSYNENAAGCELCLGVRLTLAPEGACCYAEDQCVVTDQITCEQQLGGQFMGAGSDCADVNGNGVADLCEDLCGEPPSDYVCSPREMSGAAGWQEVVMDVASAGAGEGTVCGSNVGHTVWFKVVPEVSGPMVFSTCHPSTTYDTVLAAYTGYDCEFLFYAKCNDDTSGSDCDNECGLAFGSKVEIDAVAGVPYWFMVGSYDNNSAGCSLCLGVTLELTDCSSENTPPEVEIISPSPLGCACPYTEIIGTAFEPDETFDYYTVEYRPASGGDWTQFYWGTEPVYWGTLAVWDTTGLSQGWYFLRVTAENICGLSSSAVTVLLVDAQFDSLEFRSPGSGAILGGGVCIDGTAWDHCFSEYSVGYRPMGADEFIPVDPAHQGYTDSVINDPLASWNTISVPDGTYELNVFGTDICGWVAEEIHTVTVDNTTPIGVITSPSSCQSVNGTVQIVGSAADANLAGWALYYAGGNSHGWNLINSDEEPVVDGVLGNWNTTGLPACGYTLRLIVTDQAVLNCNGAIHHQTEYVTSVSIGGGSGGGCDVNGDGTIDGDDIQVFINCLLGGLP